ncbi:MAG: NAD-dependent epimerase/dehydratase family protein [Kiritimatiellaeota bacterium]|nr:NAD-dependent epimerase/dehydratase family protein [Kiritimatiellota bacterium]
MKKVLITGITGLVGSAFAVQALRRDERLKLVAVVRDKKDLPVEKRIASTIKDQCDFDGVPGLADSLLERIDVIEGDMSDSVHLAMSPKLKGVRSIFHCAADVNLGADRDGSTYHVNLNGTKVLLDIAKELKVKSFHYVSTAYVAGTMVGEIKEGPSPAADWQNAYERSKFDAERLVRNSEIPYTIYRPSIIVGRRKDGRIRKPLAFYFILEFFGIIKDRLCGKLHKEPSDWLDMPVRLQAKISGKVFFVPIDYVVEVITDLFFMPAENQTYHLTGNSYVTTYDILLAVGKALKVKDVQIVDVIEDDMTMDEKLLHRFLGEFLPYFGSEAVFDISNVVDKFGASSINWTLKDEALFKMIHSYYQEFFPELTSADA